MARKVVVKVRNGKPYVSVGDWSPEAAKSIWRKLWAANFSYAAHTGYGKSYEEFIEHMRKMLKGKRIAPRKRKIYLMPSEYYEMLLSAFKRGVDVSRLHAQYDIEVVKRVTTVIKAIREGLIKV